MTKTFNCSEQNPSDFSGKKLIVFENEGDPYPYRLSVCVSPDGTFTLTRTAAGIATNRAGTDQENQIAIVQKPIDEATLRMMERPNSRFLNNQCDFILFLNSSRRKAQYTEPS